MGIVIALRGTGLGEVPAFATFGVIFASIVIEALPFILLGALVSAAMAVWVPGSVFTRVGRLPAVVQVPAVALVRLRAARLRVRLGAGRAAPATARGSHPPQPWRSCSARRSSTRS